MRKIRKKDKIKWLENKKYQHFSLPTCTYIDIAGEKDFCYEDIEKINKIKDIVSNPDLVAKHQFYPLISTEILERKFGKHKQIKYKLESYKNDLLILNGSKKNELKEKISDIKKNLKTCLLKSRPIKYAAHLDAHIYAYYASQILLPKYEEQLQLNNLDKEILAYREVPKDLPEETIHPRINNISMAKEIFINIIHRSCNCIALAYDLKSFFDTIDHGKLKEQWCKTLNVQRLPNDHFNIYKSLTKYCYIDIKTVCRYFNFHRHCTSGDTDTWTGDCDKCRKTKRLPNILFKNPKEFREFRKWCMNGEFKLNIGLEDKEYPYGIPQGTALSSVLSNIYLLDFDIRMKTFLDSKNATYRRYCDDILIICDMHNKDEINNYILNEIFNAGKHLKIHEIEAGNKYSKSQMYDFTDKEKIKQFPLQYLGFCFDGESVEIRGSSLNRYWRKSHDGIIASKLNVLKKLQDLKDKGILFEEKHKKMFRRKIYKKYTYLGKNNFLTYVRRAFDGMDGIDNHKIKSQLKGHMKKIKRELALCDEEIARKIDKLTNKV